MKAKLSWASGKKPVQNIVIESLVDLKKIAEDNKSDLIVSFRNIDAELNVRVYDDYVE